MKQPKVAVPLLSTWGSLQSPQTPMFWSQWIVQTPMKILLFFISIWMLVHMNSLYKRCPPQRHLRWGLPAFLTKYVYTYKELGSINYETAVQYIHYIYAARFQLQEWWTFEYRDNVSVYQNDVLWKETVQMSACFDVQCSVAPPRGEECEQVVSRVWWVSSDSGFVQILQTSLSIVVCSCPVWRLIQTIQW